MDKKIRTALVLGMTSLMSLPAYARGFGGFHGGGGFGRGGGGFDHSFDHGGGGFDHNFDQGGFGGHENHPNFGGGFNGAAGGDKPVVSNHPNYGMGGDHGVNQPNHSNFPTDGGFGNATHDRTPSAWDNGNLHTQGNNVRGNFNGDSFQHNDFNHNDFNRDVNVNNVHTGGYHAYNGYNGYHGYGGYHGYNNYYHGYNPTAAMWTFAGITSITMLSTFLGIAVISDLTGNKKNKNNSTAAAAAPVTYSNVTYNNGNVYVDGQATGSASDFYQQAQKLAASGQTSTTGSGTDSKKQWQNLGTFSITPKGSDQSDMMVQLEVNAAGVIHGTYYNQLTMETQPVYGAVDKQTQRVSWTLGQNNSTVFDAGLVDLTKEESTVLVHYGADNTQRMALVRLKKAPPGVTEPSQNQTQSST